MAMLGMQADVQCSYFPAYYSSRDLNLNASCSTWPLNNVNKIPKNGHHYNCGLTPPSPDQPSSFKEILKQKMLEHEAIFRHQIHELHRLYNRQKELMDEVKRSGFYRHHSRLENLQSNPILSQNSSEYSQKTCQISALPCLNPASSQSTISGADNNLLHLTYDEGKVTQSGRDCALTECRIKESELFESRCKKVGKKILDLELPAYEYIDSEEEESLAGLKVPPSSGTPNYPLKRISELTIGSGDLNLLFQEDNRAQNLLSRKTEGLADLNEPIKIEEETDPDSNDFLDPVLYKSTIPCQDLSGETNSDQSNEIIQNTQIKGDPEACTNFLHLDKHESQNQWLSEKDDAEQSISDLNSFPEGIHAETLSTSSEDLVIEQAHEISTSHLLDQTSRNLVSKRENFDLESSDSAVKSYPGQVADAFKHPSNQIVPLANYVSSSVSSWRQHTRDFVRAPIAVQALPCFNNYVRLSKSSKNRSPGIAGGKSPHGKNVKCNPKFHGASVQSRFCNSDNEFASEDNGSKASGDVRSTRDIDLNSLSPSCSSDVADQSVWISDGEKKLEDSTGGSPWFRAKAVHVGNPNKRCKKSTSRAESVSLQANTSILDIDSKKVEANDRQGIKRLLGMPTYNKPCMSVNYSSFHAFPLKTLENSSEDDADNGEGDGALDINLNCNSLPVSGEQLTELAVKNRHDKKLSCCGFHIDLNLCINEDESSPVPSLSTEIDLEAPASPQNKESSPPRGESNENQLEMSFQLSWTENGNLLEELDVIAAEAIVSISSSHVQTCTESTMFRPSEAVQIDSLYWLARIVSSVVDDPESEFGVVLSCEDNNPHHKHLSDGIDYFEAMTLRLKDTKMEEYCCKTYFQKEEAASTVSFPCQPRKGRTRSARQQRKDFQSEILPSLASLSRYEVTEDLQAIGGLIEASCTPWNMGARKTGRQGSTRRRKRPSVSSSNAEGAMCVLLKQQTRHGHLRIEERSPIDWGKITRRPRGQRCPASGTRLILAQV